MKSRVLNRSGFEPLERRDLMAADIVLADGVINVTGTEQADQIVVSQDAGGYRVFISDLSSGKILSLQTLAARTVDRLRIDSLSGDDLVINNSDKPALIYGGPGADKIVGGSARDVVYGEAGNDVIFGGAGHDALFGGEDNDTIFGEEGDDELSGGDGVDYLDGLGLDVVDRN